MRRSWRRKAIWNKGSEACIASGEVPDPRLRAGLAPASRRQVKPARIVPAAASPARPGSVLKDFRFPVLRDWNRVGRACAQPAFRSAPTPRYPSIVMWPHELDGQYVPELQRRAAFPTDAGFAPYAGGSAPQFTPAPATPAPP